jgi:hypothetical protein
MTSPSPNPDELRIGVVVTTVGRWAAVERLLASVAGSRHERVSVAVANQSGEAVPASLQATGAVFVPSSGGASVGRNDALRALGGDSDLVAFPNDHSTYAPELLPEVAATWLRYGNPGALIGTLVEGGAPRMEIPAAGARMNRYTVWRAIEPTMFVASEPARRLGFRPELGTGCPSPWQAGEGTDLLLRIMDEGRPVVCARHLRVHGDGERRSLSQEEWQVKLRSYARGCGYVLHLHHAGPVESAVHLAVPWYRFVRATPAGRTPARDCWQATLGRFEGRLGRCLSNPHRTLGKVALSK